MYCFVKIILFCTDSKINKNSANSKFHDTIAENRKNEFIFFNFAKNTIEWLTGKK